MLPLLKNDGAARFGFLPPTRAGETNQTKRPLLFCFNGGPALPPCGCISAASATPRQVERRRDDAAAPFGLVDNEYSILHATDLVFVDPVPTGFSRPAKDEKAEQFFGQSPDVESVGEFIRLWTTRHQRWRSPNICSAKATVSSAPGVWRTSALALWVVSQRRGAALRFAGLCHVARGAGNDLPSIVFLPAYTATAHFHKKLPADLQANLPQSAGRSPAIRPKATTPARSCTAMPCRRRNAKKIVTELARLTGLPAQLIEDNDLQVDSTLFRKMLLREQNQIIGRYDARITGRDADRASLSPQFDPSYAATLGPFSAAMNSYLREELKFENDLPLRNPAGVGPWNYDARSSYPSVANRLLRHESEPYLRVLVLGGLRDLACPIDGIRYSIDHPARSGVPARHQLRRI